MPFPVTRSFLHAYLPPPPTLHALSPAPSGNVPSPLPCLQHTQRQRILRRQRQRFARVNHSMAASTTVSLGSFVLADRAGTVSLTVAVSLTLDLPPGYPKPRTPERLHALARDGGLWILRTATCRLVVSLFANGRVLNLAEDPHLCHKLAHLVENSDVRPCCSSQPPRAH
jgi:hypothetical protein